MRILITAAGILTTLLGFDAAERLEDPALFQGALTLGGGWIICAIFSRFSMWHGYIGAAVLGLLGAARCAPALPSALRGDSPAAVYQAIAFVISATVLVTVVRLLLKERARRQLEALENE